MKQGNKYLHAEGTQFIGADDKPVQLRGCALGNWMLLEGYMWGFMGTQANRERLIEEKFRQMAGSKEADAFFPAYRKAFVTEADIRQMALLGFNSVRLPFNSRHFLLEEPGLQWKEEGFELLDQVISWCEKYRLYAILDMHAAPGGQTGSNIDDGVDDVPRLFTDMENWSRTLAVWEKIASRYADNPAVGGYDLLNEPLRPFRKGAPIEDLDYLIPSLIRFYDDCIRTIRRVDPNHLLSIEGAHWARDTRVFDHLYDTNMCIHFHAYWTLPHAELVKPYMELGNTYQVPIWLGETGENTIEWYTTLFPMLDELGISWNFWEWKKSIRRNSVYVTPQPDGWDQAIGFIRGGAKPTYAQSRQMLHEWLDYVRLENCIFVPEVPHAIMRMPDAEVSIPALAYDLEGHSISPTPIRDFRPADGMRFLARPGCRPEIDPSHAHGNSDVRTDHPWNLLDLLLTEGEYASWSVRPCQKKVRLWICYRALQPKTKLCISLGNAKAELDPLPCEKSQWAEVLSLKQTDMEARIRIQCVCGAAALTSLKLEPFDCLDP